MKLDLPFWKKASSKRKRIYSIMLIFVIVGIVSVIGSFTPLNTQDAQTISNGLNQTLNTQKANGNLTEYIFLNNFLLCLFMFVPIVGATAGFIILFDTGVALGAIASTQGYPLYIGWLSQVLTPVFWLEFLAYSVAIAESMWLTRRLLQRRWHELKNALILIGICTAILILASIVEVWLVTAFS